MLRRTAHSKLSHEEIVTISMLVGEISPLRCSCCGGKGASSRLWGQLKCVQCGGSGYDYMGKKTKEALDNMNTLRR